MTPQECAWNIRSGLSVQELLSSITSHFSIISLPEIHSKKTFYDSFDWRLYRHNLLLSKEKNEWQLHSRENGQLIASCTQHGAVRRFRKDFPQGPLRQALTAPLSVRALLPLGKLQLCLNRLRVLNEDEKTVAFIEIQYPKNPLVKKDEARLIRLQPVRGYIEEFQNIASFFDQYGNREICVPERDLLAVLSGSGRSPLDYSSKLSLRLDPNTGARQAARLIFRNLLATMRRNEAGILDDIDSEFLHDFRVALRRTRSLISLLRGGLAPEVTGHFTEEFRFIGEMTGPVRDLDVYLEMEERYHALLPERLHGGLAAFFRELAQRRRGAREQLVAALQSARYQKIISSWYEYLEREEQDTATTTDPPIGQLARKIILKRYRRILKDGNALAAESSPEELHRLRIQGKKLRYSLEFFTSLFPAEDMEILISQLKTVQDNLGAANDLAVQQKMLGAFLTALKPRSIKSREMAAAVGGLLFSMRQEQLQLRGQFEGTFAHFSGEENKALYERLFQKKRTLPDSTDCES